MFLFGFLAILLAVAVPTFSAQKENAVSANSTANIKQVVNAIESCAANNTDGAYAGGADTNCLDPAALRDYESGLEEIELGTGVPRSGGYQVATIGSEHMGYLVQAAVGDGYFAELHFPDGRLLKLCGPKPFTAASTPNDGSGDTGSCSDGTW
jgi:hypothetical protein